MNYLEFNLWVDLNKWQEICSQIYNAKELNESGNRFTKEKWILGGLQKSLFEPNVDWVDKWDYDLVFKDWEKGNIEVKTGNETLFTSTGNNKKWCTIKLKNIYQSQYDRLTLDKDFDHLMVVNLKPFGIAFCNYEVAKEHLITCKDGFLTKIPFEKLDLVYKNVNEIMVDKNIHFDPKHVILKQLTEAGY